ncbi:unnamed protein product, partial [Rotaria sp. Silwood1]
MTMINLIIPLIFGTLFSITTCEPSKDFGIMILYLTDRHPNDYNDYGCWCNTDASETTDSITVDETDSCCKIQLECYNRIKNMITSPLSDLKYRAVYYDNQFQCFDFEGTPNRNLCLCDLRAAECLKEASSTYNSGKKNIITDNILRWHPEGITVAGTTSVAGVAQNLLYGPCGLAIDSSNVLYISDSNNHRVQKWFPGASNGSTVAGQGNGIGGASDSLLNRPVAVAVDSNGTVFVVDHNNIRVQMWHEGASSGTTVAGVTGSYGLLNDRLYAPYGIDRDSRTGTLYIADYANHRIMAYSPGSSSGIVVAGGNGAGLRDNQLHAPVSVRFDPLSESLLIVNYEGHNVVRWKLGSSNWTIAAGNPHGAGGTSSMHLHYPRDVAVDRWGNIYVADNANHRIQFFRAGELNGTTIAGISAAAGNVPTQLSQPLSVALDTELN